MEELTSSNVPPLPQGSISYTNISCMEEKVLLNGQAFEMGQLQL